MNEDLHAVSEFGRGSPASSLKVIGRVVTMLISVGVTLATVIFIEDFSIPGLVYYIMGLIVVIQTSNFLRDLFVRLDDADFGFKSAWASAVDGYSMIYISLTISYFISLIAREMLRFPVSYASLLTLGFVTLLAGFSALFVMRKMIQRLFVNEE